MSNPISPKMDFDSSPEKGWRRARGVFWPSGVLSLGAGPVLINQKEFPPDTEALREGTNRYRVPSLMPNLRLGTYVSDYVNLSFQYQPWLLNGVLSSKRSWSTLHDLKARMDVMMPLGSSTSLTVHGAMGKAYSRDFREDRRPTEFFSWEVGLAVSTKGRFSPKHNTWFIEASLLKMQDAEQSVTGLVFSLGFNGLANLAGLARERGWSWR